MTPPDCRELQGYTSWLSFSRTSGCIPNSIALTAAVRPAIPPPTIIKSCCADIKQQFPQKLMPQLLHPGLGPRLNTLWARKQLCLP